MEGAAKTRHCVLLAAGQLRAAVRTHIEGLDDFHRASILAALREIEREAAVLREYIEERVAYDAGS